MKKIMLVGTGLIGGSMVLELRKAFENVSVYGVDSNSQHIERALESGLINHVATLKDAAAMDLVIVAVPVDATLEVLPQVLNMVTDKTLVMDVGSTKELICKTVENHKNRGQFLAAHPIAGTEFSGPDAALLGLFATKTMIVCEHEKTSAAIMGQAVKIISLLKRQAWMRLRTLKMNL